ncbi:MAG: sulfite exporter TauE/SafE family protein [Proteobacteria bacterium]|nr:sulfite exporter TauE/SafE family protein [Pseudomonadota bacterium]
MDFLFYIAAGAAVGFTVGITGVGGGSLMTPLLLAFGFPLHVAIGTDLLYAAVTKAGGAVSHGRRGNVDWKLASLLAAGSIPASLATVFLLYQFGTPDGYGVLLSGVLGFMLICTSAVVVFRSRLQSIAIGRDRASPPWLLPVIGLFLGIAVTLSSVGAGAITAALLLILYPAFRGVRIVGTDIAHAVPLTLAAGLGHWYLGNVDFVLLGCLLVGSLPAISFGARFSNILPERVIQPLLAVILFGVGIKLALF